MVEEKKTAKRRHTQVKFKAFMVHHFVDMNFSEESSYASIGSQTQGNFNQACICIGFGWMGAYSVHSAMIGRMLRPYLAHLCAMRCEVTLPQSAPGGFILCVHCEAASSLSPGARTYLPV
jgi:hypothetical protein